MAMVGPWFACLLGANLVACVVNRCMRDVIVWCMCKALVGGTFPCMRCGARGALFRPSQALVGII